VRGGDGSVGGGSVSPVSPPGGCAALLVAVSLRSVYGSLLTSGGFDAMFIPVHGVPRWNAGY
jgi:hypothetical protein